MSLSDVYTILNGITGFSGKVAYHAFPQGAAPAYPFIVYRETYTHNFGASNKVHCPIRHLAIELYTTTKAPATEALVEAALDNNDLFWNRTETYIDTERCYQILYEIEI